MILGIVGELFFLDVDVPNWFTTTMLALNVIGTGAVAFTVLASFAHQRNEALAALRVEQARSEALITNVLPSSIAERLKDATGSIADHVECATILFADLVNFTPLAQRMSAAEVVGTLDRLFSHFDTLVERHGLEKIKTIGDCLHGRGGCARPVRRPRDQGRQAGARHARGDRRLGDRRVWRVSNCGSASTPGPSRPG